MKTKLIYLLIGLFFAVFPGSKSVCGEVDDSGKIMVFNPLGQPPVVAVLDRSQMFSAPKGVQRHSSARW